MEKFLCPERLSIEPNANDAAKIWKHWKVTFENFLISIDSLNPDKLKTLTNYISSDVYELISDCTNYTSAVAKLESLYVKPRNEVFARHALLTRRQESVETIDQYLQALNRLAKNCEFRDATAEESRNAYVRDAFINGLRSSYIRLRLLENNVYDLKQATVQARALELAQKNAESYEHSNSYSSEQMSASTAFHPSQPSKETKEESVEHERSTSAATARYSSQTTKCFFCGYARHPRSKCPAKDAQCNNCGKKGHFRRVCKSTPNSKMTAATSTLGAICSSVSESLFPATVTLTVNGQTTQALLDTGSTESFVSEEFATSAQMHIIPSLGHVAMASLSHRAKIAGQCHVDFNLNGERYRDVKLSVLPALCTDILLGQDFLRLHKSIEIPFGGDRPTLSVCGLLAMNVDPPSLFSYLKDDCKPVVTKSRRYAQCDQEFINSEIERLTKEDIIEPSCSPWRAQVLVTAKERHKKRLVIDYSQTINRFTLLDAYPLPKIDQMIQEIAQYEVFSALDLKSLIIKSQSEQKTNSTQLLRLWASYISSNAFPSV